MLAGYKSQHSNTCTHPHNRLRVGLWKLAPIVTNHSKHQSLCHLRVLRASIWQLNVKAESEAAAGVSRIQLILAMDGSSLITVAIILQTLERGLDIKQEHSLKGDQHCNSLLPGLLELLSAHIIVSLCSYVQLWELRPALFTCQAHHNIPMSSKPTSFGKIWTVTRYIYQ